jgi:WD40 repeat protein
MTIDHRDYIGVFSDEEMPRTLAWNPDGSRIVVAADNGGSMSLSVVEAGPSGGLRETCRGSAAIATGYPCAISWRPDGKAFAIASNDSFAGGCLVSLWDASFPDKTYSVVDSRYVGVLDLAWQSTGEHLAVAYVDSTVRLWRATSEQLTGAAHHAHTLADRFTHPVDRAANAVKDGGRQPAAQVLPSGVALTSYDVVSTGGSTETVIGHDADGVFVIVAERDERIKWVSRSTQACQDFRIAPMVAVHTFGFPDIDLTLRRVSDGHVVRRVTWRMPRGLAVDPTRSYIAAVNEAGAIALFDMRTLDRICQIYIDEPAQACAFDPTGERLVVGSAVLYQFRRRG